MRLLYLIKCHQEPVQVARLLRAIYTPENAYFIHVDSKADPSVLSSLAASTRDLPNVRLLSSHRCIWGGWSFVAIDLEVMTIAERLGFRYDFFVTLSGADFPLKPQSEIERFYRDNAGKSFLSYSSDLSVWKKPEERVERIFLELPWRTKLWKVPVLRRTFPTKWKRFGGADWVNLTRGHCDYLLHEKAAQKVRAFYRYTKLPGEGFYQTVLLNSHHRSEIVDSDLREIQWPAGSAHPRTYRSVDLNLLLNSKALFARKFDSRVDDDIIKSLEAVVLRGSASGGCPGPLSIQGRS